MSNNVDVARLPKQDFATTHWSLVLAVKDRDAKSASEALAQLCEIYWYPLYAYVRRQGADAHEAQDITQAFFAHLLEKQSIANANENRGRFRAFLLTACKRFLINEWHKARATKRGGGQPLLQLDFDSGDSKYSLAAIDATTAEQLYDQQWAVALLDRTLEKLGAEYAARQRSLYFEKLKPFLAGSGEASTYKTVSQQLGISEANAKVAAHRLRKRYRELLMAEIADTVEDGGSVDDEVRDLFAAFASPKC